MALRAAPLCPSHPGEAGARLLGIVQADGTVAYTPDTLILDEAFVETSRRGPSPESRFRFAGPCRRGECVQWRNGRCRVADWAAAIGPSAGDAEAGLPDCGVRGRCRWFAQNGASACRACRFVITAPREEPGPA